MPTLTLKFEETGHVYTLGDRVLPSITQIMQAMRVGHDYSHTDPIHALRGRAVHKAVELVDKSDLDVDSIDPVVRPYLEAYLKFKDDTGFRPIYNELRLYSAQDGYAGTLDKIGVFPKIGLGIIEIKASESVDLEALKAQLSAQSRLCAMRRPTIKVKWKFGLQLSSSGKPHLITKFTSVPDAFWLDLLDDYRATI